MIPLDRGLLSLDTEVTSVLPAFSELQVLESIGTDGPVLRSARRPTTLRHLLTHTSGLAYDGFHPKQALYQDITGAPHILSGTIASMNYPLMFDPGDDFAYGIDWAGRMVASVDGRAIDRFSQEEIFDPLGMADTIVNSVPATRE